MFYSSNLKQINSDSAFENALKKMSNLENA